MDSTNQTYRGRYGNQELCSDFPFIVLDAEKDTRASYATKGEALSAFLNLDRRQTTADYPLRVLVFDQGVWIEDPVISPW